IEDKIDQHLAEFRFIAHDHDVCTAVNVEIDVNGGGLSAVLPTRPRDLADIQQKLAHIDQLKIVIATLASKVLDPLDRLRSVLRGPDDDVQTLFKLRGICRFQKQLRAAEYAGERVVEIMRDARSQ